MEKSHRIVVISVRHWNSFKGDIIAAFLRRE